MKGIVAAVIVICSLFLAIGYTNDNREQINNFSKKQEEKLKENARSVSEQEWQNDEVPLREIVSLEGTIIKQQSGKWRSLLIADPRKRFYDIQRSESMFSCRRAD
ncbi:hypothetical protein [Enterococcus faecium]|uniref:hypothetical protein n=1 Tax=Enterococcus faecium TaxID=1352 RepID=UPI002157ACB5|nr:hypothetical protein [Enterococcus faecium]